jgi:heat shock protein HslJ/uncharacterized membrane protein
MNAPVMSRSAAADPETYHALGTEPFWAVSIGGGRISYQPNIGEPEWSVPAPAPVAFPGGRQYRTDRLTVTIVRGLCSDGMSDRIYADTVTVDVDGRKWLGCGVPIDDPDFLSGTRWSIAAIDGRPVAGDDYFLDFERGRVSGGAGCNHFAGEYAMDAVTLSAREVVATEMACGAPRMGHERRVLELLRAPLSLEIGIATLELLDNDGRGLLLRPRPAAAEPGGR